MPDTDTTTDEVATLPVHEGDTPPEGQVRGMATADDLADERGDD
ncbi:hypothetical protein [Streptomyces roseoviridis]|uniref:Uncharacterized protein n=1 Tax=Streptomyces roseoviridis TaxID=67361 RepID=A0ABV5QYP8_9ACTN